MFGYRTIGFGGNASRGGGSGDIGMFTGGEADSDLMEYFTISITSDCINFGDLQAGMGGGCATSNCGSDRGISANGSAYHGHLGIIDYYTISTPANGQDFGDCFGDTQYLAAASNGTSDRGVFFGGSESLFPGTSDMIQYITISVLGDALDFGDLTQGRWDNGGTSNYTNDRAISHGGKTGSPPVTVDTMDYWTISSLGDAADFGNLDSDLREDGSCSNGVNERAISFGGYNGSAKVDAITYWTISSLGDALDFGDLTEALMTNGATSSGASGDRGVSGGSNTHTNVMQYITISVLGNSLDFGDLVTGDKWKKGCANAN